MYPEYKKFVNCHGKGIRKDNGGLAPTPADILGPFYKAGAPFMMYGNWLPPRPANRADKCVVVSGRILDTDGKPVVGTLLDIWQADANGVYDNDDYKYRGKLLATDGLYRFSTIIPGDYDISEPTDPQPHDFRCAHIHVKVTAPGFKLLTTQLYFPNDKYNPTDHWFDARRVITPPDAVFDFVLEPE